MEKVEKIKEIFVSLYETDTDWSLAADLFVAWNVDKDFKTESFASFVNWIDDNDIDNTWHFFFGYGDDFETFADDWIEEKERKDYLTYCKEPHQEEYILVDEISKWVKLD